MFAAVEHGRVLEALAHGGPAVGQQAVQAVRAVLAGAAPRDELEAMMVSQMAVTHVLALELLGGTLDRQQGLDPGAGHLAAKLMRTYTLQLEALARLRRAPRPARPPGWMDGPEPALDAREAGEEPKIAINPMQGGEAAAATPDRPGLDPAAEAGAEGGPEPDPELVELGITPDVIAAEMERLRGQFANMKELGWDLRGAWGDAPENPAALRRLAIELLTERFRRQAACARAAQLGSSQGPRPPAPVGAEAESWERRVSREREAVEAALREGRIYAPVGRGAPPDQPWGGRDGR